jgi:aminomethyltransferase
MQGDRAVGKMTAGVASPTLGIGLGYVVFDQSGHWQGQQLQVRLPDGGVHSCDIVSLPFFDPGKKIVKGVDRSIPDITT